MNIWNTDDEIKSTYGCSYIAIREKVSSDQEQVQSEPKDCPQKQKCEITKITFKTSVLTVSLASWLDRVMVGGNLFPSKSLFSLIFEPYHEKPCLSDFQPGMTQTSLHGYRRWLDIK